MADLDITSLDIALKLIKTRLDLASLPWRNAAVEHSVHLLERLSLGLRCCQEHVDESQTVEGTEDLKPGQRLLAHVSAGLLTMYIFQLMLQRRGGTAKARIQFQVQFEAVARDTAFARTFAGNISGVNVSLLEQLLS